jgi:hypothetical protein
MKNKNRNLIDPKKMTFTSKMALLHCQNWLDRNPFLAPTVALIIKKKHKAKRRTLEHYYHPYAKLYNTFLCGYYNVYLEYLCKIRYGALDLNRRGERFPAFFKKENDTEELLKTTIRQFNTIIWNVDGPLLEGFCKVLPDVKKSLNKCKGNGMKKRNRGCLSSVVTSGGFIMAMRKMPWQFKSTAYDYLLKLDLKNPEVVQKVFKGEVSI